MRLLLLLQPLINGGLGESPMLADFGGGDAPLLGEGVDRGAGNLQIVMQLINGKNVTTHRRSPSGKENRRSNNAPRQRPLTW